MTRRIARVRRSSSLLLRKYLAARWAVQVEIESVSQNGSRRLLVNLIRGMEGTCPKVLP
jgi:hypothetical protein